MKKHCLTKLSFISLLAFAGVFFACGDDSASSKSSDENGNSAGYSSEVESIRDLGRCTSEREGDTIYVVEKMRDYVCVNHAWIDASEDLGTSTPNAENGQSSMSTSSDSPTGNHHQPTSSTTTSSSSSASGSAANHKEVSDVYGVGECTAENAGNTVFVKSNSVTYICEDGAWSVFEDQGSTIPSSSSDLSVVPAYSEIADVMQLGKCNEASENAVALVKKDTSYYTCASGSWHKSEEHGYMVKKRSILGVAQKGPFKFGTPIYLRELTGENLRYTGKVYEDEISSNKGDFVIPNVNLIYPYVSVEVNGQYRNEITGAYSQKPLSLFALSDLVTDSRTKVNVNLLTHLEYGRAMYLVRKGYSVYAAKKQADQELMTAFELPTAIKYSEDLSVFEDSEDDNVDYANASLMVLNLLFLGDRSDDEIIALIDDFIKDFEKDGVWDDDSTKAVMADFAKEVDGAEIRANVKAWNILDIPNFEEQMEMFWNNVYGLGGCTSVRSGVIAKNENKYSKNFEVYYKCYAGSWVKATQIEYDTYGWDAGTNGEVKKGDVTDAKYVYRDGKWSQASVAEGGLGSCLAKNEGAISTYGSTYYVCKSRQWTKLTATEADVYGWSVGSVGEVKKGTYTDAKYVYRNGKWSAASSIESALGSCTTSYTGTVKVNESTYYICKSSAWAIATVLEYDTYGWSAGEIGEVKKGDVTDAKYVYKNGAWSAASELEASLGSCLVKDEGSIQTYNSDYYACESTKWTKITATQADIYGWSAGEVGEVKKGTYSDAKYVYRNGKWSAASSIETALGSCTTSDAGTVKVNESTYYICKSSTWTTASVLEYDTYGWSAGAAGEVKKGDVTDAKYVYRDGKWNEASAVETSLGSCLAKDEGSIQTYNSDYYACESTKWTEITATQADIYGWSASEVGEVKKGTYTDTKYVYRDGKWSEASELEISLGSCVAENANTVTIKEETYYACENTRWKELSDSEADTYGWPVGEVGEVKKGSYSNTYYISKSNGWVTASVLEYDTYGLVCSEDGAIINGTVNTNNKYVCDEAVFRVVTTDELDRNLGCTIYTRGVIDTLSANQTEVERWICTDKWNFQKIEFGLMTDARDGQTYKIVTIGTQTWMAKNLNYQYNRGTARSFCYNNEPDSCSKYGRLYTWSAVMDSAAVFSSAGKGCGHDETCTVSGTIRGVCPEGWHLPSNDEWKILLESLASSVEEQSSHWYYYDAGTKLKSTSGWIYSGNGTDAYGFSALPAGNLMRIGGDEFYGVGNYVGFWSSTERSNRYAYMVYLQHDFEYASLRENRKYNAYPVRCIKDSD